MTRQRGRDLRRRREFLAAAAATVATAGCLSDPGRGTPRDSSPTDTETPPITTDPTDTTEPVEEPPTIDAVEGDWPLPRYDAAGTRFDPEGSVPTTTPLVAWSAAYGGEWGQVAVADGTVFVAGEREILALDAASGERRWRHSLDPETAVSGPAVEDALYVAVGDEIRALSPDDGSRRWSVRTDGNTVGRLVAEGGTVYVTVEGPSEPSGAVYAVDEGGTRWRFRTEEVPVARFGSLAVAGDTVYAVGENAGSVTWHHALDRATGEERWYASGLNHSRALTVAGDALLAGGFYGHVVAQETSDGSERWERELRPAVREICAAPGGVYAASSAEKPGSLAALGLADGATRWRGRGGAVVGAGDGLVAVDDGTIRGLDRASGETRWERRGGPDATAVALADGVLFVVADDGTVRALAT